MVVVWLNIRNYGVILTSCACKKSRLELTDERHIMQRIDYITEPLEEEIYLQLLNNNNLILVNVT